MSLGPVTAVLGDLDQIILSADRASGITGSLLDFTRRQVLEPVLLDPGQLIADLIPVLSTLVGDDIKVILHVARRHQWVQVDRIQFEHVILNLVVNARDAMPTGGTLTLTVQNVEEPRAERPDHPGAPEIGVRIKVADTGRGMYKQTKDRIFDPFFSTKQMGKGSGLGLATVYAIVTQSGGGIQVESAPGEGATFLIDLPGVAGPAVAAAEQPTIATPVAGYGVVLLVEDEPAVRDFARRALEGAGFTVLSARGGKEALEASERSAVQIDVLLTDVVMEGMRGPEVARRLRVQRPDVGVMYMSGFGQDTLDRDVPGAYEAFVPKPFSADSLARTVNRVMLATRLERPAARDRLGPARPGATSVPSARGR